MDAKNIVQIPEDLTLIEVDSPSSLTLKNTGEAETYILKCTDDASLNLSIEKNANVSIIEISDAKTPSYNIKVEQNAHLRIIRIDATDKKTDTAVHQLKDSSFVYSLISLGGSQENDFNIHSDEVATDTKLFGFSLTKKDVTVKNTVRMYHNAEHCTSYQAFKYVADDDSHAIFDGKIIVQPHAQKIEAYQKNNNILLSSTAQIESDPQLEIYADDVRCSHGTTIGQIDENALFYMQSRGISYATARGMLIRSFAEEPLDVISEEWLKEGLENAISSLLKI
ncbi:MAG: SufD family Fe-S cluster assembly protein [Flavobacteriales bacterium]|nr:SufD family Fe-S cluster assembly protein [Flavobacteriales bacterium]